ncbi:MAG TPA: hypothetical protein VJA21_26600 [Verrucomicrobiae bacterium]
MKTPLLPLLFASVLAVGSCGSFAGTVTFAEFDGLANNAAIPTPPQGLPPGITATWTGFLLHTTAGDTPMSVFPTDDIAGADDATIVFSAPVWITSINVYDTSWGTDPVVVTGRRDGTNVWVYNSPGNLPWTKVTDGAGKAIDTLAFEGRWNHYDDLVIDPLFADVDGDGLNDFWEYAYFPGDLTKLTATGDYDHDGLTDAQEATKGTDPTKADTDNDGLTDNVETGTGFYVSPTDTGTDPTKADTDNDGRKDGDEVNGTPTSNPTAPDTDYDNYLDGDEVATGHDPNNPADNPEMTAIANSVAQFSGVQGQDNWFSGYRNYTLDGGGDNYDATTGFIPFAGGSDNPNPWDGMTQFWTGGQWDFNTAASAPWTELGRENTHPNGSNNGPVHWTIRRWVAANLTQVTPLAFRWHAQKGSATCIDNGVTSGLYINGQLKDSAVVRGGDTVGITHTYFANVTPGDKIDLILSPRGTDGIDVDGCDGSINRLLVDPVLPAAPRQPDGSIFVPVGAGDSDGDGLPDVWERNYFPNDLTKLTATGDFDQDGLSDVGEYQRGTDPTKADTDGDGLSDKVETGTGVYVSPTDTGSNPTKADTDGDGLSDSVEVNRTPPTNPNKADTDNDGFSDPAEIAWGTDPTNPNDNPLAFVIANSEAQFSGIQGSNGWYNGYRIFNPIAGTVNYNANQDFIPFPGGADNPNPWDGVTQTWNNGAWVLNTAGVAPWAMQGPLAVHPNGTNSAPTIGGTPDPTQEEWVIRRWVASTLTSNTPITVIWKVRKTNLANGGVTGLVFINGALADSKAIAGTDGAGEMRRYRVVLKPNDIVDLALSPEGPTGDRFDYSDGSETWFWVDVRAWPPADISLSGSSVNLAQGKFTFKWNSAPNVNYVVWVSTNLKDWTALPVVPSGGTETTFTETLGSPTPAVRFYRVSPQ